MFVDCPFFLRSLSVVHDVTYDRLFLSLENEPSENERLEIWADDQHRVFPILRHGSSKNRFFPSPCEDLTWLRIRNG